jgi:galactitol-specific phosphotransferase system IIB component
MKPSKIVKLALPQGTYKVETETLPAYIAIAHEPFGKVDFPKSKQTAIRVKFEKIIKKALVEGRLEERNMEFDGDPQTRSVIIADELSEFLSEHNIEVSVEDSPIETGRYKLEDAALAIAIATGESNKHIENKLVAAVSNRELLVYRPESDVDYEPNHISVFWEEVIWDELNIWIENSLPRIDWRFPKPVLNPDKAKKEKSAPNDNYIPLYPWCSFAREAGKEILRASPYMDLPDVAEQVHSTMLEYKNTDGSKCVTGRGSKVPAIDTILRHALTGLKS